MKRRKATYGLYYSVDAEGYRIGLMTCQRCGATVIVNTDEAKRPHEIHDAWHARPRKKVKK